MSGTAGSAPAAKSTFWWYERDGADDAGPFTEQQIRQLLAEGAISPDVWIRSSHHEPWPPGAVVGARDRPRPARPIARRLAFVSFSLLGWVLFGAVVGSAALHRGGL